MHRIRWRWGVLVAAGVTALLGATTLSKVHGRARSALDDVRVGLAFALDGWEEGTDRGSSELLVNGARFVVDVHTESVPPEEALRRAGEECLRRQFGGAWWAAYAPAPVLRSMGDEGGYVACVAPEHPWQEGPAIASAMDAWSRGLRVDALGDVHFVIAEAAEGGATVKRLVSRGPVSLERIFPATGDVVSVGSGLPRPPSSRRVLSAFREDAEPAIEGYETSLSSADVVAWYRRRLASEGWQTELLPESEALRVLFVRRDGVDALVAADAIERGSTVALVNLGARDVR